MAAWPSTIPLPRVQLSGSVVPSIIRTQMDDGEFRQRRTFTERVEIAGVELPLTKAQFDTFRTFHKDTINYGADWFDIDVALTSIPGAVKTTFDGRIVGGQYQYQTNETQVIVSFSLELRDQ